MLPLNGVCGFLAGRLARSQPALTLLLSPTPPLPHSATRSYEGTYEVNALVAGRGATGVSAIKPPRKGGVQVQA